MCVGCVGSFNLKFAFNGYSSCQLPAIQPPSRNPRPPMFPRPAPSSCSPKAGSEGPLRATVSVPLSWCSAVGCYYSPNSDLVPSLYPCTLTHTPWYTGTHFGLKRAPPGPESLTTANFLVVTASAQGTTKHVPSGKPVCTTTTSRGTLSPSRRTTMSPACCWEEEWRGRGCGGGGGGGGGWVGVWVKGRFRCLKGATTKKALVQMELRIQQERKVKAELALKRHHSLQAHAKLSKGKQGNSNGFTNVKPLCMPQPCQQPQPRQPNLWALYRHWQEGSSLAAGSTAASHPATNPNSRRPPRPPADYDGYVLVVRSWGPSFEQGGPPRVHPSRAAHAVLRLAADR
jgi:hypothetical protein